MIKITVNFGTEKMLSHYSYNYKRNHAVISWLPKKVNYVTVMRYFTNVGIS